MGVVNRYQLATRYQAVHRNVYKLGGTQLNAVQKARAAWLWSGRRATLVAAVHGKQHWTDPAHAACAAGGGSTRVARRD